MPFFFRSMLIFCSVRVVGMIGQWDSNSSWSRCSTTVVPLFLSSSALLSVMSASISTWRCLTIARAAMGTRSKDRRRFIIVRVVVYICLAVRITANIVAYHYQTYMRPIDTMQNARTTCFGFAQAAFEQLQFGLNNDWRLLENSIALVGLLVTVLISDAIFAIVALNSISLLGAQIRQAPRGRSDLYEILRVNSITHCSVLVLADIGSLIFYCLSWNYFTAHLTAAVGVIVGIRVLISEQESVLATARYHCESEVSFCSEDDHRRRQPRLPLSLLGTHHLQDVGSALRARIEQQGDTSPSRPVTTIEKVIELHRLHQQRSYSAASHHMWVKRDPSVLRQAPEESIQYSPQSSELDPSRTRNGVDKTNWKKSSQERWDIMMRQGDKNTNAVVLSCRDDGSEQVNSNNENSNSIPSGKDNAKRTKFTHLTTFMNRRKNEQTFDWRFAHFTPHYFDEGDKRLGETGAQAATLATSPLRNLGGGQALLKRPEKPQHCQKWPRKNSLLEGILFGPGAFQAHQALRQESHHPHTKRRGGGLTDIEAVTVLEYGHSVDRPWPVWSSDDESATTAAAAAASASAGSTSLATPASSVYAAASGTVAMMTDGKARESGEHRGEGERVKANGGIASLSSTSKKRGSSLRASESLTGDVESRRQSVL